MIIRQRTGEWYSARLGKFTASNFAALMARPADRSQQWSRSSVTYIQELAFQLFHNKYNESPNNDATRWGMRHEDKALQEFGHASGFNINESGFVIHPEYPEVGATPDAFVVENKNHTETVLAQVKCPFSQKNHLQYSRKIHDACTLKKCRSAIHWQIQGEIWVTGASHSYFVSYDPRIMGKERLHFVRIDRDQRAIDELEAIVRDAIVLRNNFLEELIAGRRD